MLKRHEVVGEEPEEALILHESVASSLNKLQEEVEEITKLNH